MKKTVKIGCFLLLFCIMSAAGYLRCRYSGFVGKSKEVLLFMQMNNARNYNPNVCGADLDEEDAQFVAEHVLGQWKVSDRVMALKSADSISSQGVEEMKDLLITYDKDYVIIDGYDQHTFSNRDDLYLFLYYGGDKEIHLPVYHVDRHVNKYGPSQERYRQFPKECELVHVNCNLGYDLGFYSSVLGYWGIDIYVNPEDEDILYLDMCGLWELKRVEE